MTDQVIALPTAAPRRVRQAPSRATRAQLRALLRFPDIYKPHGERVREERARKNADLMADTSATTATLLAITIYNALDSKQRARVKGQLLGLLCRDPKGPAEAALAWVETYDSAYRGDGVMSRAIAEAMKGEH